MQLWQGYGRGLVLRRPIKRQTAGQPIKKITCADAEQRHHPGLSKKGKTGTTLQEWQDHS